LDLNLKEQRQLSELLSAIRDKKNISAICSGMGERVFLAHQCFIERRIKDNNNLSTTPNSTVYICSDIINAKRVFNQLKCFHKETFFLPPKNDTLTYIEHKSLDIEFERLSAMSKALTSENACVVTTVSALTEYFPKRDVFESASFVLAVGNGKKTHNDCETEIFEQIIGAASCRPLFDSEPSNGRQEAAPIILPTTIHPKTLDEIIEYLAKISYKRVDQVSFHGTFSVRGDILDILVIGQSHGTRIEFFGDDIETIKSFDIETHTTKEKIDRTTIIPATDFIVQEADNDKITAIRKSLPSLFAAPHNEKTLSILSSLDFNFDNSPSSLSWLLPLFPHQNFFDFFSPSLIIYDEAKQCYDTLLSHTKEHQNRFKILFEKGEVYKGLEILPSLSPSPNYLLPPPLQLAFHSSLTQNRFFEPDALFNFKIRHVPSYNHNFIELKKDLENFKGFNIKIYCGDEVLKDKLEVLLSDSDNHYALCVVNYALEESVCLPDEKILLISTTALTGKKGERQKRKTQKEYFEPQVGSHVVHEIHGVGFFEKVVRLEYDGAFRDYFAILYRNNDKLYVPIENVDSLSKFIGGTDDSENVVLNKIGGQDFEKQKDKVRKKVKELAFNLAHLYAKREQQTAHRYSGKDSFFEEFCLKFPYVDTPCQTQAADECLNDLMSGKVMDRLLCGDVGYGKTEVAFRTAFKVITEGKQVALVCPTTILARQHFQSALERLGEFGVKVAQLSRMNSQKETKAILEQLECGNIDMLVGTHRILSPDVKFHDLGLLVLDEEQRFGVESKEKLKTLKSNINVLSMSATPIPRTLHMSLSGIRDLSILETPPKERKSVQTYVTGYSDSLIVDAVHREINRGGQVFIVYNNVCKMDSFESNLRKLFPTLGITRAHGQMQSKEQEDAIKTFLDGKTQILLTTTIIENGIDMPKVNTIIVINSQNFGLSQLYQLKGRVGRSNIQAYSYFTFDEEQILTETATKRLEALTQHTDLGSGYHIAMQDLAIRGAGNILGAEQSGHMAKVGYEMYTRLLSQAVKELGYGADGKIAGDADTPKIEVKVFTDFNAFVPDDYITDEDWKRKTYMRISRVSTHEERKQLMADLFDIYGKVPEPLDNLIWVALIKNLAQKIKVVSVILNKSKSALSFERVADIPSGFNASETKLDPIKGELRFVDRKAMVRFLLSER